jgi:hypothetical protein
MMRLACRLAASALLTACVYGTLAGVYLLNLSDPKEP